VSLVRLLVQDGASVSETGDQGETSLETNPADDPNKNKLKMK
jgi:hypothetical protein